MQKHTFKILTLSDSISTILFLHEQQRAVALYNLFQMAGAESGAVAFFFFIEAVFMQVIGADGAFTTIIFSWLNGYTAALFLEPQRLFFVLVCYFSIINAIFTKIFFLLFVRVFLLINWCEFFSIFFIVFIFAVFLCLIFTPKKQWRR